MNKQDFTTAIIVNQTPQQVFDAVNNVRGWWKQDMEGSSASLGDEFAVHFGDIHYSRHKLVEFVPNKKVVWLTTDSRLSFIEEKDEWIGTTISFEIMENDNHTQLRFTQHGLVDALECYGACSNAWTGYVQDSLRSLIETGEGKPTA